MAELPRHVAVLLDEAYIEFCTLQDPNESLALLERHPNLVVLRTFSKVYGLCGLRVGYSLGTEEFRLAVDRVRQPFSVNALALAAATEALRHVDELERRVEQTVVERVHVESELAERGLETTDSQANFSWVSLGDRDEDEIVERPGRTRRDRARREGAGGGGPRAGHLRHPFRERPFPRGAGRAAVGAGGAAAGSWPDRAGACCAATRDCSASPCSAPCSWCCWSRPLLWPAATSWYEGDTALGVVLLAVAVYLGSFIAAYIGVGLAAAVDAALRGQPAGLGQGLRAASSRLGAISVWALITAVLSVLLRALESRGELASIAAALVGGAWSVVSLLAVPAIALENAGPLAALKRSASIFKDHWSGQIVGMAAIGGVFLFVMLPGLVLAGIGFLVLSESGAAGVGGELLIAAGVVVFAIGAVLASALRQVFAVVLYRWATTGEAPQGFSAEDLRGAVRTRARPPRLIAASDAC